MRTPLLWKWKGTMHTALCGCTAGLALLGLVGGRPALAQACDPDATPPYLFILLDTSGSLNRAPLCSAADVTAGDCTYLCTTGDCGVPLQADDPDSKLFQVKSALHESLSASEADGIQFGFATFNQDELRARSKHWLYQAGSGGPSIPGWGAFPPSGSNDVLGRLWTCDEGTGDDEAGCVSTNPADLSDAWELSRVRRLAKGGQTFSQAVTFYVRNAGVVYRVRYTPVAGGTLGSSLSLKVRLDRCLNAACSSVTALGEPTVAFTPVSEYLVWQNGASRSQPIEYFGLTNSADTSATNTCSGWDPNTDTASDEYSSYSLRWPTVTDLRGSAFDAGDVLPFDWLADHRQEILDRLAPNQVASPLAAPDFRLSPYLNDALLTGETFLRLKDEDARPLFAHGSTPLGASLESFQTWWNAWESTASVSDPDWACRRHAVVLITDGDETCSGDPCSVADDLLTVDGIETYVVAYDVDAGATQVDCIAADGGTTAPFDANTHDELVQALKDIFTAVK
jgi:hypothetical protein